MMPSYCTTIREQKSRNFINNLNVEYRVLKEAALLLTPGVLNLILKMKW